eukprot:11821197-Alexandrium_andersonii.AAC.1
MAGGVLLVKSKKLRPDSLDACQMGIFGTLAPCAPDPCGQETPDGVLSPGVEAAQVEGMQK